MGCIVAKAASFSRVRTAALRWFECDLVPATRLQIYARLPVVYTSAPVGRTGIVLHLVFIILWLYNISLESIETISHTASSLRVVVPAFTNRTTFKRCSDKVLQYERLQMHAWRTHVAIQYTTFQCTRVLCIQCYRENGTYNNIYTLLARQNKWYARN